MKARILDSIAAGRDEILEFLSALVAVPTENPPGRAYRECADFIQDKLAEMGLEVSVVEVPDASAAGVPAEHSAVSYPRFCVLGGYGAGDRILYFHGHYDVVRASGPDQFAPHHADGRLYGRGAADMKGGLAAMIYAVRALKDCGAGIDGRIGLVMVPDEETGGRWGSRWLSEGGILGRNGIGMLTAEPTGGVVWNGSRGAISLRVTVRGRAAHVGLQHEGVNAFERMLVVARALEAFKAEVESHRTAFQVKPDAARRSILLLGGLCEGGSAFNTVPGRCAFTVDRRINPEEDLETEKRRLFAVLDHVKANGIDLEVEVLQEGAPSSAEEDSPLVQSLSAAVEDVTGSPPTLELCPGLLETRFYHAAGVPALGYGPGLLSVSHGPEEWVEVDKVLECAAVYALTAARLLAPGS